MVVNYRGKKFYDIAPGENSLAYLAGNSLKKL